MVRHIQVTDGDLEIMRATVRLLRTAKVDTAAAVEMLERWIAEAETAVPDDTGGYVFDLGDGGQ